MKRPITKPESTPAKPKVTADRTLHIEEPWSMTWMEYVDEMLEFLKTRIGPGHPLHRKKRPATRATTFEAADFTRECPIETGMLSCRAMTRTRRPCCSAFSTSPGSVQRGSPLVFFDRSNRHQDSTPNPRLWRGFDVALTVCVISTHSPLVYHAHMPERILERTTGRPMPPLDPAVSSLKPSRVWGCLYGGGPVALARAKCSAVCQLCYGIAGKNTAGLRSRHEARFP